MTSTQSVPPVIDPLDPIVTVNTEATFPGMGLAYQNGLVVPIVVAPDALNTGVDITADDWHLKLNGVLPTGKLASLNSEGKMVIDGDRRLKVYGVGFAPGTVANVYIFPGARAPIASSVGFRFLPRSAARDRGA